MKLFFHFSIESSCNSYLIGPDKGGDALLIDPGAVDVNLLRLIEGNEFYIRSILLTHNHQSHKAGLKTLAKIYNSDVFCNLPAIGECQCRRVYGGDRLDLNGIPVEVLDLPGHTSDSVAYRIEDMIFTGDSLGAGTLGNTPNSYSRAMLQKNIRSKLFSLDGHIKIFPGHGPPSVLSAERDFNPHFSEEAYYNH